MKKQETITVKVTGIQSYGVFVKYLDYNGLIHISEMSDLYVNQLNSMVSIGDEISVVILDIDDENKQLKLSYKQANKINEKIIEKEKIIIGFHSLEKAMPNWIKKAKSKGGQND